MVFLFTSVLKSFVERSLLEGHVVFEKGGRQDTCVLMGQDRHTGQMGRPKSVTIQ